MSDLATRLRERASTATATSYVLGNLVGILSELERPAEAAGIAREALPFMRRSGLLQFFVEQLIYLFALRGQFDSAARLLGASDAFAERIGSPRQPTNDG